MEQDQKEFLNSALKSVKTSSQQMKNSINQNDMRQCLKYANELLSELKTSLLSPSNYYQLYSAIFDEIIYLQNYFRDESKRGRRIKELYETVQQSISVIPRIYLLIIVGTIFIESEQCEKKEEVIYDIIQMIKGVQNPIRGLFIRYFLLKMLKDYLNCIDYLIDNFKDMNKLWIRINKMNNVSFEQIVNIRNDMKILVGENINRLACLNNLNSDIYRDKILIPIFQIISLSNDEICQQYIIECLIKAFPDEFNIKCMDFILNSLSKMNPKIDSNNIIISILDKLSRFDNPEKKSDIQSNDILRKLDESIKIIINEYNNNYNKNKDILKWELLEFSAVAVPANQDAIAQAVKSFGNDFAKSFITEEKSGRKISAQTRAILDKIKACGDELEKCQETLKGCGEALRKALAELDDPEPEEDTEEEKQYVELPDSIEIELPS